MKLIKYIILAIVITICGCKKREYVYEKDAYINFSVNATSADLNNKSVGEVVNAAGFEGDKVAVYAIKYNTGATPDDFSTANRIINTVDATVDALGAINYGTKVLFPSSKVAVYSIYPSEADKGVTIKDNSTDPVGADVELKTVAADQYDVMVGQNENLDRQKCLKDGAGEKIEFQHALAKLQVLVVADENVNGPKLLSKVVVNASSKATLESVKSLNLSNVNTAADFELFNGSMTITKTEQKVENELLLFPEMPNSITLTVDGNDYKMDITDEAKYTLRQGALNKITMKLTRLGVVLGDLTVGKWQDGGSTTGSGDYVKKKTEFKVDLIQSRDAVYVPTEPAVFTAQIQINDNYWLAKDGNDKLPCKFENGVLSLVDPVETLMISDDNINLTAIKIIKNGVVVFSGKTSIYTKNPLIINQETGAVTVDGEAVKINMSVGALGNGTQKFPYEVCDAMSLNNLRYIFEVSSVAPVHVIQTKNIDLAPHLLIDQSHNERTVEAGIESIGDADGWIPLGTYEKPLHAIYDGNKFTIAGLYINRTTATNQSLFGYVASAVASTDNRTMFANLSVEGFVKGNINTAGFASSVQGLAKFERCINKVNIVETSSGNYVGGLIARANKVVEIYQCGNEANIEAPAGSSNIVGVGGIIGAWVANSSISQCYNKGNIKAKATCLGGIIAATAASNTISYTLSDCYNVGEIENLDTAPGSRTGGIVSNWQPSSSTPQVIYNCYNKGIIKGGPRGAICGFRNSYLTANNCHHDLSVNATMTGFYAVADATSGIGTTIPNAVMLGSAWIDSDQGMPILKWEVGL